MADQPLQLISFDGQLTLNPVACAKISAIQNNISIISIIGNQKTGKSTLLNKLFLNKVQGFPINNKSQKQTRGIQMWSTPLKMADNLDYIIIDTEGIGGDGNDLQVMTLSLLVSSFLIYNSVGAIDEQTIQNLSLINHLAKTIQGDQDECFPQLLWILRDFSLQLLDTQGDNITARDYMEKALSQQRGFSDDIEQKNRTKRMLTSIFKYRDCAVLPNESSVEFNSEISSLKNRICSQLKPKKIRNMFLDGESFVEMLRMYVDYMNENMFINIQEIWDQLIEDQAIRLLNEAYKCYETTILKLELPTATFEDLKRKHKECEQLAIEYLKSKINDKDLMDELHQMCKQAFQQIQQRNEKEAYNLCATFVNRESQSLKQRLNDYKSILEFERDIKLFYQFLLEHGPKTVLKQKVFQEFYNNMMSEGAQKYIRNSQIITTEQPQSQKIDMLLQEKEKIVQELMEKIREQDKQKQFSSSQIKQLEEQLASSQKQIELLEQELLKQKDIHQQQIKQMDRNLYLKESEFMKQKALSEQRINHLNKVIESNQKKENQMDSSFISTKSEYTNQLRDIQTKYETLLNQTQERLQIQSDKVQQYQDHILSLEAQNSQLNLKLQQKETRVMDYQSQLNKMQSSFVQSDQNYTDDYEKQIKKLKDQCDLLEIQLKDKSEKLIYLKSHLEKDHALISQEKQFMEIQIQELKQQLITQKRNHEQTLILLDNQNDMGNSNRSESVNKYTFSKQYVEMKEMHINEIKQIEFEFEQQRKKLVTQIEQLGQENRLCENKLLQQQSDFTREITQLKNKLMHQEDSLIKLNRDYHILEQNKNRQQKEFEDRYNTKCKQYQMEIEDMKYKNQNEYNAIQLKNEEQINQLRQMYDTERQKIESNFMLDRKIMEDKFNSMMDEMMNECNNNNSVQEVKQLQKKLKQNEITINQLQQHWQNENEMKQKQLLTLEQVNKELKQQLSKNSNIYYQNSISAIKDENEQLLAKHEEQNKIIQQKENEIKQLQQLIQNNDQNKSSAELDKLKVTMQQEKQQLNAQLVNLKQEFEDAKDEHLRIKVDYERQLALTVQENEFHQAKISELQYFIDNQKPSEPYNFKIDSSISNYNVENELKEQQIKYDKLRQQYKEQEIQNNKLVLELKQEVEQFKNRLNQQLYDSLQSPQQRTKDNSQEVDELRRKVDQLEMEKSEIKADHDRDSILWQGKFKFLQEQKDQAKQDLNESMQKFELTINHIQKARQQDLEDEGNSISEMLITLEKKYQLQVLDLSENHSQRVREYENRIQNLEKQIRGQVDMNNSSQYYEQQQQKYEYEMEQLKIEHETRIEEILLTIQEERQNWRNKLNEAEERYKEAEAKRSNMVFEHEKERAKWHLEKDELNFAKNDLEQQNKKLELKKDSLNREVEKQKSDKKQQNKMGRIRSRLSPTKSSGEENERTKYQAILNINKLGTSYDNIQKQSIELADDNTHKSILVNPGESFEAYYQAKNQNQLD